MMKMFLSVLLASALGLAAIEVKGWVGYQGKFAEPMSEAGELAIRKVGETASFRFQILGDDKQPLREGKLMVSLSLDGGKQIFRKARIGRQREVIWQHESLPKAFSVAFPGK